MTTEITHDDSLQQFSIETETGTAYLRYKTIDDRTLDYYSTYVPISLRGKGIAGEITKAALEFAKASHYQIIPSCPYVESYINRHPEYKSLLVK